MISDELGQQWHDKVTSGETLTPQERTQLNEWYAQQDAVEIQSLSQSDGSNALNALRTQVNQALDQVKAVAQEMQDLANTNESLRQEITALRERVGRRPAPQPA